jgi:hypothetical protein
MGDLVLGVFRSTPALPMEMGAFLMALGDSQTGGRWTGAAKSPLHAEYRIWQTMRASGKVTGGMATPYNTIESGSNPYVSGRSGESLAQTHTHYNNVSSGTKNNRTWIHFQESGDQNKDGQATASGFGDTFDAFITAIRAVTPSALISTETAFNFDRGNPHTAGAGQGSYVNENFRDWTTYNTELRARVAAWAALGVTIPIAETDRDIKLLQTAIGKSAVWFCVYNETNFAHYKGPGNVMIALSMFKALRYHDIDIDDLADISTDDCSLAHKEACLEVYNAN